jgi:hypothetical protein
MRTKIFNGYNNDHPSVGTDFNTQRTIDGPIANHLSHRTKPNTFKSSHSLVEKFQHPFPLNEEDPFRTNPNLDMRHTVPTGGFRKDTRTMYSGPEFPSMKNNKLLMKTTNVFDSDFIF